MLGRQPSPCALPAPLLPLYVLRCHLVGRTALIGPPFPRRTRSPAWCFALQNVVMRLPWVFAESWVWTLLIYFCVGFVTSARLLAFWAITFAIGELWAAL